MIGWIVAGLLALCCVELLRRISNLGLLLKDQDDRLDESHETVARLQSQLLKARRHVHNVAAATQSAIEDLEK